MCGGFDFFPGVCWHWFEKAYLFYCFSGDSLAFCGKFLVAVFIHCHGEPIFLGSLVGRLMVKVPHYFCWQLLELDHISEHQFLLVVWCMGTTVCVSYFEGTEHQGVCEAIVASRSFLLVLLFSLLQVIFVLTAVAVGVVIVERLTH